MFRIVAFLAQTYAHAQVTIALCLLVVPPIARFRATVAPPTSARATSAGIRFANSAGTCGMVAALKCVDLRGTALCAFRAAAGGRGCRRALPQRHTVVFGVYTVFIHYEVLPSKRAGLFLSQRVSIADVEGLLTGARREANLRVLSTAIDLWCMYICVYVACVRTSLCIRIYA